MMSPVARVPSRYLRPQRFSGSPLDLVVLALECAGTAGAVWLAIDSWHRACAVDSDGLPALGIGIGVGLVALLLPALFLTLGGLAWQSRGALIAGRIVVVLACALGWPPILPLFIGFGIVTSLPLHC